MILNGITHIRMIKWPVRLILVHSMLWSAKCRSGWLVSQFNIGFTFLICPVSWIGPYFWWVNFFLLNKITFFLFFNNNWYSSSIEIILISLPNQKTRKITTKIIAKVHYQHVTLQDIYLKMHKKIFHIQELKLLSYIQWLYININIMIIHILLLFATKSYFNYLNFLFVLLLIYLYI